MFNFLFSYRFCCTFCCIVQILSFNSRVEAKTSHHSNFEFNMDANTIRNCDNLEDKIDCFIDAGMQYQQATSKKFKYKKFLKQVYKHLEGQDIKVDKNLKKDMESRVQNRITERFFGHSKEIHAKSQMKGYCSKAIASSGNPNGDYSNDFREGIIEIGTGLAFVASEIPPVQIAGGSLIVDGTIKFIRGTANYLWPEDHEREGSRERDRDGERPSMADRERD